MISNIREETKEGRRERKKKREKIEISSQTVKDCQF